MRRIVSVTGIRSEYDIMSSVYQAIKTHPKLALSLVVTGAHLSKEFGMTVDQIQKDGFDISDRVESLINGDRDASRVKGMATQLMGLVQSIDRLRPDILLVFGDREESLTTAIVGAYLNIPVAHISGGDRVVGNVDDQVRHATTKLAHLHFATNEESKQRILHLGEQPFRVFNTGNPGLDRLAGAEWIDRETLLQWYGFDDKSFDQPLLVVIQHVISTEIKYAYSQMRETLEAVCELGFNTVVSFPNSDAGSQDIIRCIRDYADRPFIKGHRNIPRSQFVNSLRHAACLVGNSSAGILEAPFLKLPVVNVGNRQKERMHAGNVSFVPHDRPSIVRAIQKSCFDEDYKVQVQNCTSPYGDGHSSERIARILAEVELNEKLLLKDITY